MSAYGPYERAHGVDPEMELEVERAREQELEAKAQRYAALHPDDPEAPSRGLGQRLRRLFRRSK
jgi:hypothetical protein